MFHQLTTFKTVSQKLTKEEEKMPLLQRFKPVETVLYPTLAHCPGQGLFSEQNYSCCIENCNKKFFLHSAFDPPGALFTKLNCAFGRSFENFLF
jgi:hypothetical protein